MNFSTLSRAWIISLACPCLSPVGLRGAEVPAPLKVQVDAPASWQPIAGDGVRPAIAQRLIDAFAPCGLSQPVDVLRPVEDAARTPYLLTVHLQDRSINREGGLAFPFTATLKTPAGTREFGPFGVLVDNWLGEGRPLDLGKPLAAASERALRDLCEDLGLTQLRTVPAASLTS